MLRTILGFCVILLLSNISKAEQTYENSCDPAKYGECYNITRFYHESDRMSGRPIVKMFPVPSKEDKTRENILVRLGLKGALEGCVNGDAWRCHDIFSFLLIENTNLTNEEIISALRTGISSLETSCTSGNPQACYFRLAQQDMQIRLYGWVIDDQTTIDDIFQHQKQFAGPDALPHMIKTAQNRATLLTPSCMDEGNPEACKELSTILESATTRKERASSDYRQRSNDLHFRTCMMGDNGACEKMRSYFDRFEKLKTSNINDAYRKQVNHYANLLNASCEDGNAEACYAHDAFLPRKEKGDIKITDRTCNKGHGEVCTLLGQLKYREFLGSLENEDLLKQANDYWEKGCAVKDAISCHALEHGRKWKMLDPADYNLTPGS